MVNDNIYENKKELVASYKKSVDQFLKGNIHPTKFRGIRVPMGIYEQRTNNTFMMRLRIPAGGGITPKQLTRLADLSEKYGSGVLHVTTRQDIQLHKVRLEDTPEIMASLFEIGLSTQGGGGNTVRNVTACAESGVCEHEVFDVSPYATALTEYLIRDPRSYTLPRKYKVAFSGCPSDCSLATVNDVGFIATTKEIEGKTVKGFRVYVAGGMGNQSRIADLLEEFVTPDQVPGITEAIKRVFDKNGNRRNKHKARLRFLREKEGKEGFLKLYQAEHNALKQEGDPTLDITLPPEAPTQNAAPTELPESSNEAFHKWAQSNLQKQRQKGYYSAVIRFPLGEVPASNMRDLANIIEPFGNTALIATHDQNLLLKWLTGEDAASLFEALKKSNLDWAPEKIRDVVCCAGAATCRLGICLSKGLSEAVSNKLEEIPEALKVSNDVKIKVSGCPNACGHHPIGHIGVVGAARRIGEHTAPYYILNIGGKIKEGETRFGDVVGLAHSKYIPSVIAEFIKIYAETKGSYDNFHKYAEQKGSEDLKAILKRYSKVPSYEEDKSFYSDWSSDEEFSLAGRGAGECGAGVFDMIEVDLNEGKQAVDTAIKNAEINSSQDPAPLLYEAITRSSRALLVTRGAEAKQDSEAFDLFEKEFIDTGLVEGKFSKLMYMAAEFQKGNLKGEALQERSALIQELVLSVKSLYDSMDESLQFNKTEKTTSEEKEKTKVAPAPAKSDDIMLLDLRGVQCPFNYVKTKLKLETMEEGDQLELYLDDGSPIKNVPNSLKNDGHEILKMEQTTEGYFDLIIKKV